MKRHKFIKKSLIVTGSWFLLLVFSVIQVLPALHTHSEFKRMSELSAYNKSDNKQSLDTYSADCLICNFIAQKQVDYPSDLSAPVSSFYAGKPLILNTDYCQQLFESAVQTWTNKGPPTI